MLYFECSDVATCSSLLSFSEQYLRHKSDLSAKCLFEDLDQCYSDNLVLFDEVLHHTAKFPNRQPLRFEVLLYERGREMAVVRKIDQDHVFSYQREKLYKSTAA